MTSEVNIDKMQMAAIFSLCRPIWVK